MGNACCSINKILFLFLSIKRNFINENNKHSPNIHDMCKSNTNAWLSKDTRKSWLLMPSKSINQWNQVLRKNILSWSIVHARLLELLSFLYLHMHHQRQIGTIFHMATIWGLAWMPLQLASKSTTILGNTQSNPSLAKIHSISSWPLHNAITSDQWTSHFFAHKH